MVPCGQTRATNPTNTTHPSAPRPQIQARSIMSNMNTIAKISTKTKSAVRKSLCYQPMFFNTHNNPRKETFTDDDLDDVRQLLDKQKADDKAKLEQEMFEKRQDELRMEALEKLWKEQAGYAGALGDAERPGIFRVTQDKNNDYDTFVEFIAIAHSEGEARGIHPRERKDAFTYNGSQLDRHEEWQQRRGNLGPAPAWYLGDHDEWCHGAYVKVERISDYVPPEGQEPKYGIVSSSYRGG